MVQTKGLGQQETNGVNIIQNLFKVNPLHFLYPHRIEISTSFYIHVKTMYTWKRTMIINTFTHCPTCLITKLQQRSTMFITTDGSKTDKKSGGTWTLSTPHDQLLAHG